MAQPCNKRIHVHFLYRRSHKFSQKLWKRHLLEVVSGISVKSDKRGVLFKLSNIINTSPYERSAPYALWDILSNV